MGSTYLRGSIYWIQWYKDGVPHRESTGSRKESEAKKLLKLREGQAVENRFPGFRAERTNFNELCDDLIADYKVNKRKSFDRAELSVNHLKKFFGNCRAMDITTDRIREYSILRQSVGAKNATINRELSALKRMFKLAYQHTPPKVIRVPHIPMLKENNVRTGYFGPAEFEALLANLPDYFKPVAIMAYDLGMRKEEILSLKWSQMSLTDRKIMLESGSTKNEESRLIKMTDTVYEAICEQRIIHDRDFPDSPYVFTFSGKKMYWFYRAWRKACKASGLEGRIFHDLRRTAVRNMMRSGVQEKVAMKISGHKTRSVFDRYNIVNEEDLKRAAECVNRLHEDEGRNVRKQHRHNSGTIVLFPTKKDSTKLG